MSKDPTIGKQQLVFSHPKHICYLFLDGEWYVSGDQSLDHSDMADVQWTKTRDMLREASPEIRLLHIIPKPKLQSLDKAFLYLEKTNADGEFLNAIPCSNILAAMLAVGIKSYKVYVTEEDQKWHKLSVYLKEHPQYLNQ